MLPTPATCDWSSRNDFSGARAAGGALAEDLGRELGRERLDPELREARREPVVVDQEGLAEAARVGEPELAPVVEQEAGPQVALRGRALALVEAHPLRRVDLLLALDQDQVAGHPQVHDQGLAAVELQQQVLAAPPQPLDRPSRRPPSRPVAAGTGRVQRSSSTSSRSIRRPSISGSSWRQTVSTSGSSGIRPFYSAEVVVVLACGKNCDLDAGWSGRPWRGGGR